MRRPLAALALCLALASPATAGTATRYFSLNLGQNNGGLASTVVYVVRTQDGTVRADTTASPGTNVTEYTGGTGSVAFTGQYQIAVPGFDSSWQGNFYIKETTTGKTASAPFGAVQTGDSFALIGTAGAGLTAVGDTAGTTTLLTRVPGVVQPQTGDGYARLGAPAGASIAADIATRATAAAILASPANLLATDSQGRVTTPTYAVRATVVAGSTASSVTVSGLPTNASYAGQHIYRPTTTGESRRISGDTVSGSNHVLTFTGAAAPFDAAFGAAPATNEVVSIGP